MYRAVIVSSLLILSCVPCLHATVLIPKTTQDLAYEADVVVVARVASVADPAPGREARAFSFFVLEVLETLKGRVQGPVTLKVLGGQTGEDPKTARIDGVPRFFRGQESVFYLRARPEEDGRFYGVVGWGQGKRNLSDPSTLEDGRKLGELREEVRRSVETPRPRSAKDPKKPSVASGPEKDPSKVRAVKPVRRHAPRKTTASAMGVEPDGPVLPPLTDREKEKLRETRRETGR